MDDNISRLMVKGKAATKIQVCNLLRLMCTERANEIAADAPPLQAWSCNSCSNSYGQVQPTEPVRKLSLLYGPMTCIRRPSDEQVEAIATRHGPIADDLERSLRIGKVFGPMAIGRMSEWALTKQKPPGQWNPSPGGISALFPTDAAFQAAKRQQMRALANEFPGRIVVRDDIRAGWKWGPERNSPYAI